MTPTHTGGLIKDSEGNTVTLARKQDIVLVRFPQTNGKWSSKRYAYYMPHDRVISYLTGMWVYVKVGMQVKTVKIVFSTICSTCSEGEPHVTKEELKQATRSIEGLADKSDVKKVREYYGV